MVTCVGSPAHGSQSTYPSASGRSNVAALEGRIQQARVQLNDWTTCVSASTPKGQSEIQKLSGEISADEQKIAQAQQSQAAIPHVRTNSAQGSSTPSGQCGALVDVWA